MSSLCELELQAVDLSSLSIAIATPSLRETFSGYYVKCTHDLHKLFSTEGIDFELLLEGRISLVQHARNRLINRFLTETNCTHILFIDDDIGFKAEHLIEMLKWSHLPVIGAMYPRREIDWNKVKQVIDQNKDIDPSDIAVCAASYARNVGWLGEAPDIAMISDAKPFEVNYISTGLMLISRDCLVKMIESDALPIYNFEEQINNEIKIKPFYEFFRASIDKDGRFIGEDVYFCRLIRDFGIPLYAYGAIHMVHSGATDHFGYPEMKQKYGMGL